MEKQNKKITKIQKNKTITHLNKLTDEANKLYTVCKNENGSHAVEPTVWLLNQTMMRKKWDDYILQFENVPDDKKNVIFNSNFSKYTKFMYDSYPNEFGEKLYKNCEAKFNHNHTTTKYGIKYDAADIYLNLTMNNTI